MASLQQMTCRRVASCAANVQVQLLLTSATTALQAVAEGQAAGAPATGNASTDPAHASHHMLLACRKRLLAGLAGGAAR